VAGNSVQCLVTVEPADASNPTVIWSVYNQSGSAVIGPGGLLSGLAEGTVDVIAASEDGSAVADTMTLTILGSVVLVSEIQISSAGGVNEIVSGEKLQYSATVLPEDATSKEVGWGVIQGTGTASIDTGGLLTGGNPGMVQVYALAMDDSGKGDTLGLTITEPLVPVSSISISTEGGSTEMEVGSSLQCTADVLPSNATNPAVEWEVVDGTGSGTISSGGLLYAQEAGTLWVVATASDGSGVSHTLAINVNSPAILVSSLSILSDGGVREVDVGNTLQFTAVVLPENASNKAVSWDVVQGTGAADITQSGLLTAEQEGAVVVEAMTLDGSGISTNFALNITGPTGTLLRAGNGALRLYPNPSPGRFYLDMGTLSPEGLRVFNTMGKLVLALPHEPGNRVLEIDLSDQPPGLYVVQVIFSGHTAIQGVMITKQPWK